MRIFKIAACKKHILKFTSHLCYLSVSLQPTRKDQAAALLELLLRKDNRAYISFYNALITEAYEDLANLLHGDLPQISLSALKGSSDGFTPTGEKGKRCAVTIDCTVGAILIEHFALLQ